MIAILGLAPVATAGHLVGGGEIGMAVTMDATDVECQTATALRQELFEAAGRAVEPRPQVGNDSSTCKTSLSLCIDFTDWQRAQSFYSRFEQKVKNMGLDAVVNIIGECDDHGAR